MNVKLELLSNAIRDLIMHYLPYLEIDADEITDTTATKIIEEIKEVLHNEEYDDFMVVDEIVSIFIKNGIDIGGRHDF